MVRVEDDGLIDQGPTTKREGYSAAVCALYKMGRSTRAIATALGCSQRTVCDIVRAAGIQLRPRGGANNTSKLKDTVFAMSVAKLYAASASELAHTYGVHKMTIYKARRAARERESAK